MKIMDLLNIPFGYVMQFFYRFIPNYAVDLLLFAVFVKLILLPFGIKQQKNMIKQAKLRPKEMAIRKKYAGRTDKVTQQKQSQEIMDFYQREGYSPFGGCLPLLLQFPVIISLYNVVRNPLTYICHLGNSIGQIAERCKEFGVSASTEIHYIQCIRDHFSSFTDILPEGFTVEQLPNFEIFGGAVNLADTPAVSQMNWLLLIPILTFVSYYVGMKISRKYTYQPPQSGAGGDAMMSTKWMDITMPLMSTFITFTVPAVLGVYWIYQSLLTPIQQILLCKLMPYPEFTEADFKAAEREMLGSSRLKKERKEEKRRSLCSDDEEETGDARASEKEEAAGTPADIPVLKEDRDGSRPEIRKEKDTPVRSLHHIDDDEYDHGVWKGKDWNKKD